jgi:hypothetical protein
MCTGVSGGIRRKKPGARNIRSVVPPTIASAHMYANERDVDIAGVNDLLYMVLYLLELHPKVLGTRYGDQVLAT